MSRNLRDYNANNRRRPAALHRQIPLLLLILFLSPVIYAQTQINISFNIQQPTCFGLPNGSVTAVASGGTGPYSYVWNTGVVGQTLSGITAGSYSVTVNDAAGRTATQTVTVNQPALITASISSSSGCNPPFTLTAQGGGGVEPYRYHWTTGATTQSITVTGGSFCVTITDKNNCGAVGCINLGSDPLTLSAVAQPVTCPDGSDGRATANPIGGMGPYTFRWSNGATTQTIQNLSPGSYSVTVTDAKGCTAVASASVANRPPIVITLNTIPPTCQNDVNGVISTSVSGGNPPYTFRWNTGATTQSLNNVGAGTYTVTVTDSKNCEAVKSVVLEPKSRLQLRVTATNEICPRENNGTITATPSGSTGPYTYQWSNGATSQMLINLAPGIYRVTVTDFFGCTAVGFDTVRAAVNLTIRATGTNKTTCNVNNGTATVSVTSGVAPYRYRWNTGDTTQTIRNLSGGRYIITVTDARGCQARDTVVLTEPPAIAVDVVGRALICPGINNGTARAVVTGGTPPFRFSWSTSATTDSIGNLGAGLYRVTVTDANECTATDSLRINTSAAITVNIVGNNIVCGETGTTNVTAQVTGGVPPFTFLWNTGLMTQTVVGLTPGAYTVTVTDANGCQATGNIGVTAVVLNALIRSSNVRCFGERNGFAVASVAGGTAPYTFRWSNNATTDSIGGLGIGTYTVTITDANRCQITQSVTITQPPNLTLAISADTLLCPGETNGFAKATISGGVSPYTFRWSNSATTDSIGGLGAGTYRVTVTDANGCTRVDSVIIRVAPAINLQVEATRVVCGSENTGTASVIVTGGRPPYRFRWSTGSSSNRVENLTSGVYTVTVTDANDCVAATEVEVRVISDFAVNVVPRNVLCHGDNSGSILVTASGGNAPYTYAWSNGATSAEVTNLIAGTYTVTVTDANGCKITQTVNITQPPRLTANNVGKNLSCANANDGSASVTATGGTPPYTYVWSNGRTTEQITGLTVGAYTVTITDANFCRTTASVTITQPHPLVAIINSTNIKCNGERSGRASVMATGGTPPYSFAWSNGATGAVINNLTAGIYTVTVTDANECTAEATMSIGEPPLLQLSLTANNIVCTSAQVGSVTAIVTGGTTPYTFRWSNGATTSSITNLPGGTYSVTVTDANGCKVEGSTGVAQIPNLEVRATRTNVTCFGANDGTSTAVATGDNPPYRYRWSTGDTTATIRQLAPGTYRVTVTGAAGCTGEASVTITQPAALTAILTKNDATCNGLANGRITATPAGGTPPYSYAWSNGASTASITGLAAGTFSVTITDANECSTTATTTVGQPAALAVALNIARGVCEGDSNGAINTTVTGGTSPYTYRWSNNQTSASLNNVGAGVYTVTVTDANNCTATASITLTAFAKPICSITIVQELNARGAANGAARIEATAGIGPYSFRWSNGQTTQTITGLTAGAYSATVTDANGCTSTCRVELKPPARIGDFVWLDNNRNGIQDPGEPGIGNVTVIVTGTAEGTPYRDSTKTDVNGKYFFDVPPGSYKVTFVLPAGADLIPTRQNVGADDTKDSDIDSVMLMTQVITVQRGEENLTLDAGFYDRCINLTNPGTIGYDQYLCGPGNDPAPIVELTAPRGGEGAIEYLWMMSTVGGPFNNTFWHPIPNSNTRDYDPGPLFETTYFIRCTRRENCPFLETNIVAIVVGNETVAEIISPNFVCEDVPVTFTAKDEGAGATYRWDFGPAATPRFANGRIANTVFNVFGTFEVQLTVSKGNCTSFGRKRVVVTSLCSGLTIDANAINNQTVRVDWQAPLDGQDYEFNVERSKDGDAFESIARVAVPQRIIGNLRHYQYTDETPKKGYNHYRVRVTDPNNNRTLLSEVETVILYADSKLLHFFPNPVTDRLTVEIFDAMNDDVQLQLVSPSGVVLQTVQVPKDAQRQELDLSELPAGTYFIKVRYGRIDVKVLKVLKP